MPLRPLLPALLGASLLAATGAAVQPPDVRAVVTYDGAAPALRGVDVLQALPGVRALVVEGPAAAGEDDGGVGRHAAHAGAAPS